MLDNPQNIADGLPEIAFGGYRLLTRHRLKERRRRQHIRGWQARRRFAGVRSESRSMRVGWTQSTID
jgi:hypothetical protein